MGSIEIRNLTKKFNDFMAVDDLSLKINSGSLFGLLGPNGAGKTTIVSMISTLLQPTAGQIFINGMDIKKHAREVKSFLGVVPQELALYTTLSPVENLSFFGKLYGLKGQELKNRIENILNLIGLEKRAKDPINTFSGGMKRRVNLGVGLINSPEIVIFDEPTVGIDPQSRNHILETIKHLNKEGMTVIYTSHYMEEVEYLCDEIGIIDQGELIKCGNKDNIKKELGIEQLILQCKPPFKHKLQMIKDIEGILEVTAEETSITIETKNVSSHVGQILDKLKNQQIKIDGMDIKSPNLESIFLSLTGKRLRDD